MIFKEDKGMNYFLNFCPFIMIQNENLRHNYQIIHFFNIEIYVHAPARAKKDKIGVSQKNNIFFDVQVMYIPSFK